MFSFFSLSSHGPLRHRRFDDTDEYEQYESNIDLLESQIDDCSNEWWSIKAIKDAFAAPSASHHEVAMMMMLCI